jgi:hypothetical protein
MATIQISNNTAFGGMTNRTIASLISNQTSMERIKDAITTASSGYEGVPGTQFEDPQGLFGITADPANPGQKGTDYSYAMSELANAWASFWTAAQPYIEQLDNGMYSM